MRYHELYPGIDLVIGDGSSGNVPWRLEARQGVDPKAVELRVEGADAATAEAGRLQLGMRGRVVDVALPTWSIADVATGSGVRPFRPPARAGLRPCPIPPHN